MKKILLILSLLFVTVLTWGQTPQPDTVKMATVFKNIAEVNSALSNLQNASNIVVNSVMPSKDAQQASNLIFAIIEYIQKNTVPYKPGSVTVNNIGKADVVNIGEEKKPVPKKK